MMADSQLGCEILDEKKEKKSLNLNLTHLNLDTHQLHLIVD